jgi:hypothetical protein
MAPFRRRLTCTRRDASTVEGVLEDHIHHFEVTVVADRGLVAGISSRPVRAPWSMCPGAATALQELVGAPVGLPARAVDPTQHCTHLLDLASATVRFAGGDLASRRYDVTVEGWDGPATHATVVRDDGVSLEWTAARTTITAPEPFAGRSLGAGFSAWAGRTFDPDTAEMALVLRRATWMSMSRGIDLDEFERLGDTLVPHGSCYASQSERIDLAFRNRGSSLRALDDLR